MQGHGSPPDKERGDRLTMNDDRRVSPPEVLRMVPIHATQYTLIQVDEWAKRRSMAVYGPNTRITSGEGVHHLIYPIYYHDLRAFDWVRYRSMLACYCVAYFAVGIYFGVRSWLIIPVGDVSRFCIAERKCGVCAWCRG